MLLVKNGLVFDAVHEEGRNIDVLVDGTKIVKMEENIAVDASMEVLDAKGMHVYPGFIDCHSHLGLAGTAIGFEGTDYNEMTDSITPHLRAIDAFQPMDKTLRDAYEGGVTSVCSGPGSANVLGGFFASFKTCGKRIDDMLMDAHAAMKCAFGENPKRVYKDKNNFSRMSTAAKLREMLTKAKEYNAKIEAAQGDVNKMPAFDMKLDALLKVVRKEIPLKAHAHQANDIFTALRIAKEFDVLITLEHVTDGSLIVEELAQENVMLAVGPSLGHATKYELVNKSFKTVKDLVDAGCHVSIITDAPVIPQENLTLCAAYAMKEGLDAFNTLKTITINPARHMGLENRIGSLEVGKDADIVVMDGCCFEVASNVVTTIIDGKKVYEKVSA